MLAAEGLQAAQELGVRRDETTFTLHGFHQYRRHLFGRNRVVEHRIRQQVETLDVARVGLSVDRALITVRVVGVEDIGQQRSEAPTLHGLAGRGGASTDPCGCARV